MGKKKVHIKTKVNRIGRFLQDHKKYKAWHKTQFWRPKNLLQSKKPTFLLFLNLDQTDSSQNLTKIFEMQQAPLVENKTWLINPKPP